MKAKIIIGVSLIVILLFSIGVFLYMKPSKIIYFYKNNQFYFSSMTKHNDYELVGTYRCRNDNCSEQEYILVHDADVFLLDNTYVYYDFLNKKKVNLALDLNKKYKMSQAGEKTITFLEDNGSCKLAHFFILDKTTGKRLQEITEDRFGCDDVKYSALHVLGDYYMSSLPGSGANYVNVYNKNFERILDASTFSFITNKNNDELVTSKISNEPVYYGYPGSDKNYEIYNQKGEKIYTSRTFKALVYLTESYVIAVDDDNILKIFDYQEKPLKEIMEWNESKSIQCIVKDGRLNITIDNVNTEEFATLYSYDLNTLELSQKELDYKLMRR